MGVLFISFIVILLFICIFVFSIFAIKRQKAISGFIIGYSRLSINLINSFLYIPFIDVCLMILNCGTFKSQ